MCIHLEMHFSKLLVNCPHWIQKVVSGIHWRTHSMLRCSKYTVSKRFTRHFFEMGWNRYRRKRAWRTEESPTLKNTFDEEIMQMDHPSWCNGPFLTALMARWTYVLYNHYNHGTSMLVQTRKQIINRSKSVGNQRQRFWTHFYFKHFPT